MLKFQQDRSSGREITNRKRYQPMSNQQNTNVTVKEISPAEARWIAEGNKLAKEWDESKPAKLKFKRHPMVNKMLRERGAVFTNALGYRYYRTDERTPRNYKKQIIPVPTPTGGFYTLDGKRLSFRAIKRFELHFNAEQGVYRIWVVFRDFIDHEDGSRQYLRRDARRPLSYWFMSEAEVRQALYKIKTEKRPLYPEWWNEKEFTNLELYEAPYEYVNHEMGMVELVGTPVEYVEPDDEIKFWRNQAVEALAPEYGVETIHGQIAEKQWLVDYGPARWPY